MHVHDVIIKPIISEASLKDAALGKYSFLVAKSANKTEIKNAIEKTFDVKVVKISTNITKGSTTRNTRVGRTVTDFSNKKARVMLSKGQSIAIFDEHLGLDDDKKKKTVKEAKKVEKKETKKEGKE